MGGSSLNFCKKSHCYLSELKFHMEQKLLHILQKCTNFNELKQTHLQIFIHGLQQSNFILPKLINFSSTTFNSLDYAIQIFDYSLSPNVFVYNTMIECFIQKSRRKEAFFTYNSMMTTKVSPPSSIISPNNFTFTILLKSCQSSQELEDGRQLQTHIVKLGFGSNVFVQNTLLDFYSKCYNQNIDSARQVFQEMLERDIVSWNSIIGAYMARGETDSAIRLFDLMPERNVVSWNTIITGLSRSGDMETAISVFKQMPIRNEVSWNAMITGYMRRDDVRNARLLFDQMPEKTVVSWTAMLSGYAKVQDLETMSTFFDSMPVKNVISWNAMIAGYVQNHKFDQGLSFFHQMLVIGEFRPNETTLLSVLSACTHLGALEQGKWIDSYIKKQKMDLSTSLGNALIDMFAKCGDVENARLVFNQMTKRCIITWTTMISGLAINGKCREALDLFAALCRERVEPDDVIFIAVLSACTHGGLVEDGKRVFNCMLKQFGIKPRIEHYGCMVDLLGRAGMVEEAFRFITSMPMQANAVIWATLLCSCKVYGKGELLEVVTRKILDLEPSNPAYLMLISNLNASVGRWEDVLSVRAAMRKEGIEKVPGCSSIQVGNKVHEFLVKDTIHEQRKEVYEILHVLNDHLIAVDDVHLQVQLEY